MGFDDIQWELGVATQCGQCEPCARDTLTQCQASNRRAHCDNAVLRSATQPSHGVLDAATPGLHTLAIS
jgi:bacterioferritin-associated ferredoxin